MAEPSTPPAPYVFLSYTTPDRARVLALADRLEATGIRVWVDRRDLVGGSTWDASIVDAIRDCTVFALTCSARSLASPNVQQEVRLAWEDQRPVLPLLLEQVTIPRELRYPLAGRQWVELLDRSEEVWLSDVLRALASLGVVTTQPGAAMAPAPPPVVSPATNLPAPLTSFIGREQELAELVRLLGTARLVTLTGPGGSGKTRLALQVAAAVLDAFPDGVWFIDLSGVLDPAGVVPAIAQVLGVRESEGRSLAVALAASLRRKHLLLVVDNFEQVVDAALVLHDLLAEAPGLTLLVTSRMLLHLAGEQEYAVLPLPLPDSSTDATPVMVGQHAAVQLFVARAQAVQRGFALTPANAQAVAELCRRLDGLPLAIELAAARVKLLPPVALLARLDRRLPLLMGTARDAPARQQTLRATIQWSWDLLTPVEQTLFRRLAVFTGGFALEAAEAVCNPDGALDVLSGLGALVDQSLVLQREVNGASRFDLLATLQEFALEQLAACGEEAALRHASCAYFCALAERANEAAWQSGCWQRDLLQPLDAERDNLFGSLGWALAHTAAEPGLRLVGALGVWFYLRAPGEGLRWAEAALGRDTTGQPIPARVLALAAWTASLAAMQLAQSEVAVRWAREAATHFRACTERAWLSRTLAATAVFLPRAEANQALRLVEEAGTLAQATGERYTIAYVENLSGATRRFDRGDEVRARAHFEYALRLTRTLGADWLTMVTSVNLAWLELAQGHIPEAVALLHEALPVADALNDRQLAIHIRTQLALFVPPADPRAPAAWRTALRQAHQLGSEAIAAACLAGAAGALTAQGRPVEAAQLLAVSEGTWRDEEHAWIYKEQYRLAAAPALAATRAALSDAAFVQAWAAGQALSLDQATDFALAELASTAPGASRANPAGA